MEQAFEELADGLAALGYGYVNHFLGHQQVLDLLEVLRLHEENNQFHKAGIGTAHQHTIDTDVRGDYIRWIDPNNALPPTRVYLDVMQSCINYLNRSLYVGIRDFEAHFAYYPPGTFYKRHLDQLRINDHRRLSFILYLNPNWHPGDGGELRLYLPDSLGEKHLDIEPLGGRLLVFRSDLLEHEVLTTNTNRYSITGWMLDVPQTISFIA